MENEAKREAPVKRIKESSEGSDFKPAGSHTTQFTKRQTKGANQNTKSKKGSNE